MNKAQFLRELERYLVNIPEGDRMDAVAYYRDYFEEAGEDKEAQVIEELGSPKKVAQSIMEDYKAASGGGTAGSYTDPAKEQDPYKAYNETHRSGAAQNNSGNSYQSTPHQRTVSEQKAINILLILIAVFTFPVWFSILSGIFGTVIGLAGSGFGLSIGGISLAITALFAGGGMETFAMLGVGLLLLSLGLWLVLLCAWIGIVWIPKLIKLIVKAVKGIGKEKPQGGNEI